MQEGSDPMEGRVARFADVTARGSAMAFIDSVLPGHLRMNYAVVGDTAVEDPDFRAALEIPHRFQIGLFEAPPGNGPGWHSHEYVELFIPLTGRWRYIYGDEEDGADSPNGEIFLDPWDSISFPPGLWRALSNVSDSNAWSLAVLDPHDPFVFKDPVWPESIVQKAAALGVRADERGRMIKPENFSDLERSIIDQIHPDLQLT